MRAISRRAFLKRAGAASAAVGFPILVPASALGRDGTTAPSERLGIAVIGFRNMGANHIRTLLGRDNAVVRALCDVDTQVLEKWLPQAKAKDAGCIGTQDFREVVTRDDIDGVVIGTPDHTHAVISMAAMKHGKDVYCEKPLTHNIEEGKAVMDAARRYGTVFQVGTQRRWRWRSTIQSIRNGDIGRVRFMEIVGGRRAGTVTNWTPEPVPDHFDYDKWLGPAPMVPYHSQRCHYVYKFNRDYCDGDLSNMGAHAWDMPVWALFDNGPFGKVKVSGTGKSRRGLHNVYYDVHVTYEFDSGLKVVSRDRSGPVPEAEGLQKIECHPAVKVDFWGDGNKGTPPAEGILPGPVYAGPGGHMDNWLWAMKTRKECIAPVDGGFYTATLCHLASIAIDLGREITFDSNKLEFVNDDEANRMRGRAMRAPWGFDCV